MRFMILLKADKNTEAGILPDQKVFDDMIRFNEELVKAGVMLSGDGLQPSSQGARVKFSKESVVVTDGPFPETKELICGFWIWQVKSKQEAIEWLKRAPLGGDTEVEIRRLYEMEELGDGCTPEVKARDAKLREEIAARK